MSNLSIQEINWYGIFIILYKQELKQVTKITFSKIVPCS